jgi:tRNA threonylcarbamoyladenosine biosynthesis protein TsaB
LRILGIDTALGACSVALLDKGIVIAGAHADMPRGHAEALAPMAEAVMREAGAAFSSLNRIAVTTGPGTFTGQRVGLAFARAMALGLGIPAVGVTTLDVMAQEALTLGDAGWAVALCDAKRGEVYLGARTRNGETCLSPMVLPLENAVERIVENARRFAAPLLAGTGAALLAPLLLARGVTAVTTTLLQPDAIFVARLGGTLRPEDHPPAPLYLRAPDAKLPTR